MGRLSTIVLYNISGKDGQLISIKKSLYNITVEKTDQRSLSIYVGVLTANTAQKC